MEKGGDVRCQRIGCDAMFTEDNNTEGSCRFHDSGVSQISHLPVLFLQNINKFLICKTGKHTTEKPVTKTVSANPQKPVPLPSASQNKKHDNSCSRCRQGFFCSDHGSQGRPSKPSVAATEKDDHVEKASAPPVKKIVDLNEPQICRNKGCGKTFKEKDNHESACEYHPGPAIFHDRLRGWKCCDIHVKEFDEFLNIRPCTKGWHNADAA